VPITLSVDHEGRTATVVASGRITMDEIRNHLMKEREQGALAYREFVDASGAEPMLSTADARATVDLIKTMGGRSGPTAVIVPNEVAYGLMRMIEILLDGLTEVRPFRKDEVAEARRWLDAQ